ARTYPSSEREFSRINGVGEKKLQEFGEVFLMEIAAHLLTNPRQIFADDSFTAATPAPKPHLNSTARETLKFFRDGKSVEEIARLRDFATSTIYGHLATAIETGEKIELNQLLTDEEQKEIAEAFEKFGFANIVGVKEFLQNKFEYGLLRIYRAAAQQK
ncbi:MAG: helix-turn-helix domain-containing protein, partial [Verrucomicrobiota bacterium]|nr:helix-turn-helix domain-containing protein [Verrucomicrobiota bacterium]